MHGPINVKSPNNTSKWRMGINSAFKGLNYLVHRQCCRSQWARDLRRRSAAARLLSLWVRILPGHGCLSVVSVVCCQVEVSATS
jgi:hypothetical protein